MPDKFRAAAALTCSAIRLVVELPLGVNAAVQAGDVIVLADGSEDLRTRAQASMITSLTTALDELRNYLKAEPVSLDTLPLEIAAGWITQDGRAKIEILPKGDPNDNETLRQFARAVQEVEPNATGGPISILESGRTVIKAFIEAGFWALGSIAILLWIVLRRFGDVLLTIIPLLMAGIVLHILASFVCLFAPNIEVLSVARGLPRNTKMTTSTMTSVSPRARNTFFIDSRMNTELSIFTSTLMSLGRPSRISFISFFTADATSSTLAVDSGVTGIRIAGPSLVAAPLRWFSAASCTSATSPRRTR